MRWLRFNIVGVMGAVIQFALLAFLGRVVSMHYLLATVLSVEAAVLHNFIWHWRWTWRDRRGAAGRAIAALARFNLTNGLVSITANLLSAFLLTGAWQIDPIIASLVSTAVGSLANFLLLDRLVFCELAHQERAVGLPPCHHWGSPHNSRVTADCVDSNEVSGAKDLRQSHAEAGQQFGIVQRLGVFAHLDMAARPVKVRKSRFRIKHPYGSCPSGKILLSLARKVVRRVRN